MTICVLWKPSTAVRNGLYIGIYRRGTLQAIYWYIYRGASVGAVTLVYMEGVSTDLMLCIC